MISAFGTLIAVAIVVFFSVEGFSGNVALNVLLVLAGLAAFSAAGFSMTRSWRARPRG